MFSKEASFPGASKGVTVWEWVKEFADDNFKFNKNGRKFIKQVENTVGKREIVHYEQFLLFQQCFQKTCPANREKPGLLWE